MEIPGAIFFQNKWKLNSSRPTKCQLPKPRLTNKSWNMHSFIAASKQYVRLSEAPSWRKQAWINRRLRGESNWEIVSFRFVSLVRARVRAVCLPSGIRSQKWLPIFAFFLCLAGFPFSLFALATFPFSLVWVMYNVYKVYKVYRMCKMVQSGSSV